MKTERVENYNGMGAVRFERCLHPRSSKWWVCLTDMAALFPRTVEGFNLDSWLGYQKGFGLDQFLEKRGEEVWGIYATSMRHLCDIYAIAIELARVPKDSDFNGFPIWIASLGRRA